MEHLALYRKWRPQRFSDLVGQDAISRTLLNAMAQDRLAHAYLFCGPRGTGKTSTARLLAKALNCQQPQAGEPCNACSSCQEITAGHSLDVIEIDAASNRGIDDARELREQVRFSASGGGYRVFIIDEFHMLTNEAFNALLKTLEEPPANVIFVLATTEPHKILQTIVSRCQRFDFQRIALPPLLKHLQKVAAAEQIGVSPQALEAIARKAAGGGRDALSLLDQVHAMSVPGEDLPDALVYQVLGLIDEETLLHLAQSLFQGQIEPLLRTLQTLLENGHDTLQIIQELLQLLRHLTLAHLPAEKMESLGVPAHLIPQLKPVAQMLSAGQSVSVIEQLLKSADRLHKVTQPEIWLEADLIQICLQAEHSLLARIEILESGHRPAKQTAQVVHSERVPLPIPEHRVSKPIAEQVPNESVKELESAEIWIPDEDPTEAGEPLHAPLPVAEEIASELQERLEKPVLPEFNSPMGESELREIWLRFLAGVLEQQGPLYGFMSNGKLVHIDPVRCQWLVRFNSRPHKERIEKSLKTGRLTPLIEEIMGRPFEVVLELIGGSSSAQEPSATPVLPPAADRPLPPPALPVPNLGSQERIQAPPLDPSLSNTRIPVEIQPVEMSEAAPDMLPVDTPPADALPERAVRTPEDVSFARTQPLDAVAELFKGKVIRLES
jgi:DNA polymerase III subunit gamma/tau